MRRTCSRRPYGNRFDTNFKQRSDSFAVLWTELQFAVDQLGSCANSHLATWIYVASCSDRLRSGPVP